MGLSRCSPTVHQEASVNYFKPLWCFPQNIDNLNIVTLYTHMHTHTRERERSTERNQVAKQ